MEFEPKHFLRCHSKTDTDTANVSTQVWQAVFEPNVGSKMSYLVATCGGDKVCVINVKTGIVQYRYSYSKGLLYTVSWCTACPNNNILVTSGTACTIVFIDLQSESAYLTYNLFQSKKLRKVFVCSTIFHPYERKLFCAVNTGNIFILGFDIDGSRIVNIVQLNTIETECEIFGLTVCEKMNYLLIATNKGLMGTTISDKYSHKPTVFELPANPNELYKYQHEKVIDCIEVVNGSWIATKVALHGVIYIFNLETVLANMNNNKCVVQPTYILNWSDTDNYFMSCGIGLGGKLVACGDDKGGVWIYDLKHLDFKTVQKNTETIDPNKVLKWPKVHDSYLKKKKKLEVDIYDIVVAKCAVHCSGKYLVAVTNNNFVCIYSK
ncbi:leucine-rich repeat and WD repeat-containing protein 1-like [Adelges cooleyi]|uniref:leucine-rich repeat and WD repeat-containing protein 1-like n=1 Tax=Adelges cooleyi TaxID=133065 RepID=UPI00217F6C84|nr:leucine-rich repeat and WD repeat-containing protein 1-like [Adelges cooleyi]